MDEYKKLLDKLDLSKLDCDYADIRIEKTLSSKLMYFEKELKVSSNTPSLGAFLRVYRDGNWAYKSTTNLLEIESDFTSLCESLSLLKADTKLPWPKREPIKFHKNFYGEESCLKTTLGEKKELCMALMDIMLNEPTVVGPRVAYTDFYKEKWFKASDGVEFYYDTNLAGVVSLFTLVDGENRFEDKSNLFFMNGSDKVEFASEKLKEVINEGKKFINAPTIKPGKYKVLLDSEITGIFTHESFGHKSEADFMLGDESMKEEWQLGKKVGSDILSIVDEGETERSSGHIPIDDEGNIKEKTYLIKDGKLAGRLHSTQTSLLLDEKPTGNARAMNFQYEPIVRMTNTYIEPGAKSVEQMVESIEDGLYIKGAKHGMGMSTFTIAPSMAYRIKDGKITEPVKVSVISGNVFETLNLIEEVGNDFVIKSSAFGGCGKMEQFPLPVADGGPTILVSEMTVS